MESTGNRVTWSYDKTYQLTNEQRSGSNSYNFTYTYGPPGNRTVVINGGVRTTSTYNPANELTKSQSAAGITTYTSDLSGNLLTSHNPSNQRTTNTWDFENRLTQVVLPSAIVDSFTYNGDGQRVQKIDSTGTTKHVWDGQNILLETDGSNIIQVVYTLQPELYGNLVSQRRSGVSSFYLFDGLGSTTQLANSTGSVTDSYLYDSWGNNLLTSGSTTNWFRYVGQLGYYYDTDLSGYHLRARIYDPALGLFLTRDPAGMIRNGAAINLYRYARNSPPRWSDPSGLVPILVPIYACCCIPCGAGLAFYITPCALVCNGNGDFGACMSGCVSEAWQNSPEYTRNTLRFSCGCCGAALTADLCIGLIGINPIKGALLCGALIGIFFPFGPIGR